MSLTVDKNRERNFSGEDFNPFLQPSITQFSEFPNELILEIFSHFNLATLGTSCRVSKEWKRLANEPILWKRAIYRELAFGNDKWAHYFGKEVVKEEDSLEEFTSLPAADFIADCKKFKSLFPDRKEKECLMLVRLPKTLDGRLNLQTLGKLASRYFPNSGTGYRHTWSRMVDEIGNQSIDQSYWVLMTKDILPDSRNKSYSDQQKMVADLADKSLLHYEVPTMLEAVTCILAHYFKSANRLFSDHPRTYTHCKDQFEDCPIVVGCFTPLGLYLQ